MKDSAKLHDRYFGSDHVTVIEPTTGWRMLDIREIWVYRELFYVLTMRDIKIRYKQTVLGVAWAIIQPVTMMIVFSVIFGNMAKIPSQSFPYPIFVYAGLLPWLFFANSVTTSSLSLVGSAHLVSKVYFPRLIIPLSSVGVGLVDLVISSVVLLLMMLYYGVAWTANMLAIPLLLAGVIFTALGVGTLLSAVTVAYRDFRYVVPFLVHVWMFASPVIYPSKLVSENWQWLLLSNPMTGFIDGFRSAFLGNPFDFGAIAISLAVAMVIFIWGIAYFEKVERHFADII